MKRSLLTLAISIIFMMASLSACGKKDDGTAESKPSETIASSEVTLDTEAEVLKELDELVAADPEPVKVISFLEGNVSKLPEESVSIALIKLEDVQKAYRFILQDSYQPVRIQHMMLEQFRVDYDISSLYDIEDEAVKSLLAKTKENGYKVERVESSFFPIIDYETYKKLAEAATDDIKDYVHFMARESDQATGKDLGIVILWDELIDRALELERFIGKHTDSMKYEYMKMRYASYLNQLFVGAINTPAFIGETASDGGILDDELKLAYEKVIAGTAESELKDALSDYYEVLKKNCFRLTDEVEKQMSTAIEDLMNQAN